MNNELLSPVSTALCKQKIINKQLKVYLQVHNEHSSPPYIPACHILPWPPSASSGLVKQVSARELIMTFTGSNSSSGFSKVTAISLSLKVEFVCALYPHGNGTSKRRG
ncbi:hypothetical protein PoB_004726900 [Plakobranchus ocellatus]|uniref:Uncharacterized protein n=1 Tax=Plakobranchus ocellatus TaxID=259542 RepID=A0AAV4BKT1_9GAST|nr:hypothetical protein PoB_004726900 [Plakobranchus ocellatus]